MPIETYPETISMVKSKLAVIVGQDKLNKTYTHRSMRQMLREVGASEAQIAGALDYCYKHGFSYCLDTDFPITDYNGDETYPPAFACTWGADQLLSRLWAVS